VNPTPGLALLAALSLGCQRGPPLCVFDGTTIGGTPAPVVIFNPDGSVATDSRYVWQEFTWPTDPALDTVESTRTAWIFRGKTGGQPWSFTGTFSGPGGSFVRTAETGSPPQIAVDGKGGRPVLLRYRLRPCREFTGSASGVRTCVEWGRELNARTRLNCTF
jgi:hypothetical protein